MGAPIKITPAIEKEIAKQTCENPEMGAADVVHKIQEIFGVKISRSSVNKAQSKLNSQQPQKITSQDLTETEIANRIDFYIMQLDGKIDFSKDLKFPDESELITPNNSPPKAIVSTQIPKTDVYEYGNDFKSQPQPQKQLSTVKQLPLPNAVAPVKTYKTADSGYISKSENAKPNLIAQYAEAKFKPPQVYTNSCHTHHIYMKLHDNEKTSSIKSMQVVNGQKPVPKKAQISKKPEKTEVIEATKEEVHEEFIKPEMSSSYLNGNNINYNNHQNGNLKYKRPSYPDTRRRHQDALFEEKGSEFRATKLNLKDGRYATKIEPCLIQPVHFYLTVFK